MVGCARLDGGRGAVLSSALRRPLWLTHSPLIGAWNLRLEYVLPVAHDLRKQHMSDERKCWLVSSPFQWVLGLLLCMGSGFFFFFCHFNTFSEIMHLKKKWYQSGRGTLGTAHRIDWFSVFSLLRFLPISLIIETEWHQEWEHQGEMRTSSLGE